jgi:hypothetical protein
MSRAKTAPVSTKTSPGPVRFEPGDFADVECVNGAGLTVHVYNADRGSWVCSHCGGEARPETPPTVKRMQEVETPPWRPPVQPVEALYELTNGDSIAFPLTDPAGYFVAVRPLGAGQAIGFAAHEVRAITFRFPKEKS